MSRTRHHRHRSNVGRVHQNHVPYWRRARSDWHFWVGVVLMFAAMIIYVMIGDLASRLASYSRGRCRAGRKIAESRKEPLIA